MILRGTVVRGAGLGRKLGFPTANLRLPCLDSVPCGVFGAEVSGAKVGGTRPGVCNVGFRPTVDAAGAKIVEVHILDFDGDLYDSELAVRLLDKLRDEVRFPDFAALKGQIARDVAAARRPKA